MANSLTKIQDTCKIFPAGKFARSNGFWITNEDPYFGGIVSWTPYNANPNVNPGRVSVGEARVFGAGSIIYSPITNFIFPVDPIKTPFVGFIFTVEMSAGQVGKIGLDDNGSYTIEFFESGRYVAILDVGVAATNITIGLKTAPDSSAPMVIKEFGMFDPQSIGYEDLLVDPVAKLKAERMLVPSGPNLGNKIPWSEDFRSTTVGRMPPGFGNWNILSVTPNAAQSPDGLNNATRLSSSGSAEGNYAFILPVSSGEGYIYSVWVKQGVGSGNWRINVAVANSLNQYLTEDSITFSPASYPEWTRISFYYKPPANAAYMQFMIRAIAAVNGDNLLVWGEQVVAGGERGAYVATYGKAAEANLSGPRFNTGTIYTPSANPSIGFATSAPDYGNFNLGSRLENIAWDGKFSTPVAWVCTAPGNPGTWKAVYLFDALNSTVDPFFYGKVGTLGVAGNWYGITNDAGNITLAPGNAFINNPGVGYTGIQQNIPGVCVPNEIMTVEWDIAQFTGSASLLLVQLGNGTTVNCSVGSGSVDKTNASNMTLPGQVAAYIDQPGTCNIRKLLVRAKYPFLTTAPSSFAALPTVGAWNASGFSYDQWYVSSGVTYAANAITIPNSGSITQKVKALIPGKTYRLRYNVSANPGGTTTEVRIVVATDGGNTVYFDSNVGTNSVGMHEVTFTPTGPGVKIAIFNMASASISFNYLRLYAE